LLEALSHKLNTRGITLKKTVLIARILFGLLFLVSGFNHVHHLPFMPMKLKTGDAGVFAALLTSTKYITVVGVLEFIGGLLLLIGRYVPLGLTVLGPIIVNILMYQLLIAKGGAGLGLALAAIELFLIWANRHSFRGLFDAASGPY
jgi:putative oxidoreductase